MEIGKTYIIDTNASTGLRGKRVKVIKVTKTTVWITFDQIPRMGSTTWLYKSVFRIWAKELSPWSGSKLIHNFI